VHLSDNAALAESTYSLLREILSKAIDIKAKTDTINWADITAILGKLGTFTGTDTVASLLYDVKTFLTTDANIVSDAEVTGLAKFSAKSGSITFTATGEQTVADFGTTVKQITITLKTSGVDPGESVCLRIYIDGTNYFETTIASGSDASLSTQYGAGVKITLYGTYVDGFTVYYAYSTIEGNVP
jgi:hypothetical protein